MTNTTSRPRQILNGPSARERIDLRRLSPTVDPNATAPRYGDPQIWSAWGILRGSEDGGTETFTSVAASPAPSHTTTDSVEEKDNWSLAYQPGDIQGAF